MSDALMKFDPATGWEKPYPSQAAQWRAWNGKVAWLFNPWTGERRNAADVGSDPFGHLIVAPGEQVEAAQPPAQADGQKLWLWRNGDHFLAFAHEYPCYEPGGDPMTLGEPAGYALFRQSHDRAGQQPAQQPIGHGDFGG